MGAGFPILGWSAFASTGMLLWGLAAVVPLLIHLWMRRRYRTMSWAAMEYLLAAVRQNSRKWRIEQWLLLSVRTLVLLLMALAWADPMWSRSPTRGGDSLLSRTHYLLVIDASYSMAARKGEKTRFDEAKALAAELVRTARQGDGFTLVLMSQSPRVVIGEPTFDPEVVLAELQSQSILDTGADLLATLNEVDRLIEHVAKTYPRLERQRVALFTDLGRTTWAAVESPESQQRLRRLADRAEMSLADVGRGEVANLAITRVELRDPLVVVGRDVTVEAEVRSFASSEQSRRVVELYVDGQPSGVREIDVPSAGRVAVTFSPRFETPGDHTIEIRLRDDALDVDNARWLAVSVRERIRVLCVEGKPDDARYIALALEPEAAATSRIEVEVASETAISERDLSTYDVLFLCNVGRFDPGEAAALRRFVLAGGGLAVFAGDLVQADNYHQWLGPRANEPAILPVQLGRVLPDTGAGVDPLNYRHPLVAPFRGQPQSGLLSTPVWRFWEMTPYDREQTRIALALTNGAPLVADGRAGQGRCLVFATAASPESVDRTSQPPTPWTALPAWPSFVPLIQETLHLLVQAGTASHNVQVGRPITGMLAIPLTGVSLEAVGPLSSRRAEGEVERVPLTQQGAESTWTYQPAPRSGLYQLRTVGALLPTQWFAVNVDTDESDLTRFDLELLPTALKGLDELESAEVASTIRAARHPWFRYLLMFAGGLLITETVLAWRLGTRTSSWPAKGK